MDAFYTYTYGTAAWLGVQAGTLVLTPKLIITLLAEEAHYSSDLEIYFARALGFSLFSLALTTLFYTGAIPVSSSTSQPVSLEDAAITAPYAIPVIWVTMIFHATSMLYSYIRWSNAGLSGFLLGAFGSGGMAIVGLWCIMFGTSTGRRSKRTGRDKRMAGFPFKNVNEYDKRTDRKVQ